jgi:hypothetical protein
MPSLREEHYASELVNVVEIRPETRRLAVDIQFEEARVVIDEKLQPTLDEWYANEQKRMQEKATWHRCLRRWASKNSSFM